MLASGGENVKEVVVALPVRLDLLSSEPQNCASVVTKQARMRIRFQPRNT